jgi:acyl carrier protein
MPTNRAIERAAILREVIDIFRSVFEDPHLELTLDTTSDDLPCWDSMNHITLIVEAECRFDIQFQTAELEDLTSVRDLVQIIHAKRALAHAF